jgi:hypothetical protein
MGESFFGRNANEGNQKSRTLARAIVGLPGGDISAADLTPFVPFLPGV